MILADNRHVAGKGRLGTANRERRWPPPALLLRLILIGWKHAPRAALSRRSLLGSITRLLSEWALLLAIHLPGWSSHLRSAEGGWLVRTAQQNI